MAQIRNLTRGVSYTMQKPPARVLAGLDAIRAERSTMKACLMNSSEFARICSSGRMGRVLLLPVGSPIWVVTTAASAVAVAAGVGALYRALSMAYDFSIAAKRVPQDYAEILDDAGIGDRRNDRDDPHLTCDQQGRTRCLRDGDGDLAAHQLRVEAQRSPEFLIRLIPAFDRPAGKPEHASVKRRPEKSQRFQPRCLRRHRRDDRGPDPVHETERDGPAQAVAERDPVRAHVRGDAPRRRRPASGSPAPAHPVIRTVVVEPQMAKLRKKSATTIVTMLVLIACPTARPTPAGPPEAV